MKTLYKQYIVATLVVIAASITLSMLLLGQIYNAQIRPDADKENFEVAQEVKRILNAMPEESYNEYFRSIAKLGYQVTIANEAGQTTHYGTTFKKMI